MCQALGKWVLVIINIVFFIGGGLMLALGLISIFKEDLLYKVTDLVIGSLSGVFDQLEILAQIDLVQLIKTNAIILCVIGGVLFVLGFLGVCGACKMNKTLLNIYAIIVLVLLAVQIGLGVYAYMYADEFEDKIKQGLRLALFKTYEEGYRYGNVSYLVSSQEGQEVAFDSLQIYMQCCGVTNRSEWIDADAKWNRTYATNPTDPMSTAAIHANVPPSCCKFKPEQIPKDEGILAIPKDSFINLQNCMETGSGENVQDKVCYDQLKDVILENQNIVIIVFVIVIAVQVVGVACACYLKNKEDDK